MSNSTPSSVLNELAKNNKVSAYYQVVNESGPAHQKLYTVHLRIGGKGPFEGVGTSMKNARNAAASRALMEGAPGLHVNPTVELNILSMKSGEMVLYRELDSVSLPPRTDQYDSLFISQQYRAGVLQRLSRPMPNRNRKLWRMSVQICGRTYVGEGHTKSEARGNAASHALLELKPHLLDKAKRMEIERAQQLQATKAGSEQVEKTKSSSFVSDLHELANRYHLEIDFDTVSENGPPHIKTFCVKCKVGDKEVLGQGVGKKIAKNDAAEKMLHILKELPLVEPKKKSSRSRSKKEKQKVDTGIDPGLDAITYLTQLLQLRKEKPVEYTLKADNGPQQKGLMRFHMIAAVGDFKGVGYGESKKAAKLNSAMNLLKSLGIDLDELRKDKGIKEMKEDHTEIIDKTISSLKSPQKMHTLNRAPGSPVSHRVQININDAALLDGDYPSAKDKLEHIARAEGFQVLYNDFVNKSEFSSQLRVFTTPTEVFHGVGTSVDASREDAAKKALEAIVVDKMHELEIRNSMFKIF